MNDQDFLGYVKIHSQTPRALFSGADVRRFFELAGESADVTCALVSMYWPEIQDMWVQADKNSRDPTYLTPKQRRFKDFPQEMKTEAPRLLAAHRQRQQDLTPNCPSSKRKVFSSDPKGLLWCSPT